MATNQQTSFERSLDLFRRELSDDQIKQINGVNQKTVTDTIQEIQGKLGRRNDLCRLTRIQKFLHAMEHIEKLVTIFLNANDFVAFIWGPIKLALMVATTWTDAIRQLIDAYEEIAAALGNLAFFHNLIQSMDHLKLVLDDYFSDILRFHRCVLDVFSRPEWKRLFKWAWGSFRREVKPILESLKRKQALLSDDKLQSHAILKEVQDSDQYARNQFSNLQTTLEDIKSTLAHEQLQSKTSEVQGMKSYLESRLDVSKSRTDLQLESRDSILEDSGSWLFTDTDFKSWEEGKSPEARVLFLNGSPGSGKSTLAKTIIRHKQRNQAAEPPGRNLLAYFFFKHDAADRRTARSMLQHLIMQLVNTDETLMRFVYDRLSTTEPTELADLKKLAIECLTSRLLATLVLDGLDEAIDKEHEVSINWCLSELLPAAKLSGCKLNILICGQRDGRLDALLSPYSQIRLESVVDHRHDIEQFTKGEAAKIRARFSLTQEEEESLISKVSEASHGMFLYARVVLDNLAAMDSIQEFEDELESGVFPEDLDHAYERIAHRILKQHGSSRHTTVKKILGWVVCAARPLRWREIQSRFCIDAYKEICNIRNLRRDSCKSICSSLVDVTNCDLFPSVETEQIVSMVHQTATEYLVRSGTVDLLQEHIDMALFCCRYLSSRPFTTGKDQDINTHIQSGYFGFLDYAATHHAVHMQKAAEISRGSAFKLESVKAAAAELAKVHCTEALVETGEIDKAAQDLNLAIQKNVLGVRTLLNLQREKSGATAFDAMEGPMRHKCYKIQCSKFSTGYPSETALREHLAVHERPYRCPHINCFAHRIGYASSKRLESHNEVFHQSISRSKAVFPAELKAVKWNLNEACKAGNLDEVKRFHREGANLEGDKGKVVTPLFAAAEAGHGHVCKYLVDNGIDPFHHKRDARSPRNPITVVIKESYLEILEFFLHIGSGPDDSNLAESISWAIQAGNSAALSITLTIRQPMDHADVIGLVLDRIVYDAQWKPVRGGVHSMHSTDAALLHAWFQYVKPEFYNEKGVFAAQPDCTEYKIWGDLFFRQLNSFHKAIIEGCYPLATFLMDIGNAEYLQLEDANGDTPVHSCVKSVCRGDCSSCEYMVRRLLQYDGGKSCNMADSDGSLLAHIALRYHAPQTVLRAVLDNTGDINHRDNSGRSLLHVASSADSIRVLLENKSVDLFSRNNRGQTAFSAFIDRSYIVEVEVLDHLFKAASTLAWTPDESEEGLTPLHYALRHLESDKLDSYNLQSSGIAAKFLLTCSEVNQVLVEYQAKSTEADRNKLRGFAEKAIRNH